MDLDGGFLKPELMMFHLDKGFLMKNTGTPVPLKNHSCLWGFSLINHPCWATPILGNAQMNLNGGNGSKWMCPQIGVPQGRWMIYFHGISQSKMDDFGGAPPFRKPPNGWWIYIYIL